MLPRVTCWNSGLDHEFRHALRSEALATLMVVLNRQVPFLVSLGESFVCSPNGDPMVLLTNATEPLYFTDIGVHDKLRCFNGERLLVEGAYEYATRWYE